MNNVVSIADLVKVNENPMYRNNSLSTMKTNKSATKNQFFNLENKFMPRNQMRTAQTSKVELFDNFYQTVKPTDDKTFKKTINF